MEHNGSLSLLHRITALDPTVADLFGSNVSQFGNLIVIGSPGSDPNGISLGGAAYLYRLEANGSLTHLHKITAPDAAENDQFGGHLGNSSIAQYDNLIAIGATNADPNGVSAAGAFYLYRLEDNGSVSFLQKFISPRGQENGQFGKSVSLFERTLTIGTHGEDINGVANAGAVYVFDIAELTNRSPANLSTTAPLTIAENQPIGAVVGDFNATDPDGGATLTYHLVSGAGDTHNSFFTLETNGTLKTATVFDYESNASSYSIRCKPGTSSTHPWKATTVTLTDFTKPRQLRPPTSTPPRH